MEEIMRQLKELKKAVAAGNVSDAHLDMLNGIIAVCEKKKGMLDALAEPTRDLLPEEGEIAPAQMVNITVERLVINIGSGEGKDIPPCLPINFIRDSLMGGVTLSNSGEKIKKGGRGYGRGTEKEVEDHQDL